MPRRGENIYKRKDGRWEGRYRAANQLSGKTKYRSVYGKSYQEVKRKLLICKTQSDHEASSGKLTVTELFSEWLSAVRNSVKESTFANYTMKINHHILPVFGTVPYELLTSAAVHDFITRKIDSGLSAKYVSDIIIILKSMAKYMKRVHGYRNPVEYVNLPKQKRHEKSLYSAAQQRNLTAFLMRNINLTSLGILLSLYTGLRIGEICGLKWKDIDYSQKILNVNRTVQRIQTATGSKLSVTAPKTASARRSIPIPSCIIKLLRRFSSAGELYVLSGTEQPVEPRTMQNRYHAMLKKAGLPSINYHSLRHMFATNSLQAGFDIKTLSEILGHASVETTLRAYVHSSMERKAVCMNLLMKKVDLPSLFSSEDDQNIA